MESNLTVTTPFPAPSPSTVEGLHQQIGQLDRQQIRAWQRMRPHERLTIAFQAYQLALETVRVTEQRRHPDLSPGELAWRITRRMQGNSRLGR